MRERLRTLMVGRYGVDSLSIMLFVVGAIIALAAPFSGHYVICSVVSYALFGWYIYRAFSRQIYKRSAENQKFLNCIKPVTRHMQKFKFKCKDRSVYKYYVCKNCGQKLRFPRGKGKIEITCPKCQNKFMGRT